jgi:coenzyme F420-reducing hydrogenase delta subunit
MRRKPEFTLALFYCRNIPGSTEKERQSLEQEYDGALRLFPLPCSGRMEPLHLMKSLEEFADAAYLITCPEGDCRYSEGNTRASKRVARACGILADIGLEKERIGIVANTRENPRPLAALAKEIMQKAARLGPSPVFHSPVKGKRERTRNGKDTVPSDQGLSADQMG